MIERRASLRSAPRASTRYARTGAIARRISMRPGTSAPPGLPLIAPLVIPRRRARAKFADDTEATCAGGYSVHGARGLARWAVAQLQEKLTDLSEAERRQLARLSPHAFRQTFGTQSVATAAANHVGIRDGRTEAAPVRAREVPRAARE
ncbi:hypothetical protein DIE19_33700 [Burkholderia sp. Bp9126]|nr:hypothetical protein DIE19_33700 [Burkholderia sp. Bp9126]